MNKKKVWRYYCDHCRKGGCSAGHMRKHELGCTRNPNRVCGVCREMELNPKPLSELVEFVKEQATGPDSEFDRSLQIDEPDTALLREMADNCPVCMLAALRQGNAFGAKFSMKEELKSMWADHNDARMQREHG